jgi:putative oxidoreductase
VISVRVESVALLVARVFLASLFVWSGVEKALDIHGAAQFAASHGIPFALQLMPLAAALEIGCAVMLVTGWRARSAALILAVWMLVLGPWFHPFWNAPPEQWQVMIDDFFHHIVMIGGMIYVAVCGPGGIALPLNRTTAQE